MKTFKNLFSRKRKSILLLVDQKDWAYDNSAKQIAKLLDQHYRFDIKYVAKTPHIDKKKYDLIYVFFWGENYHNKFHFNRDMVIKEVSSYRWQDKNLYGPCTPEEFTNKFLKDAATITSTSKRMKKLVSSYHKRVFFTPNGFDPSLFFYKYPRNGPMKIGWAGNINDEVKGYYDVLQPACNGFFNLETASGNIPHKKMNDFYNSIDVIAITSRHEGQPLTLMEAMAAGCFPVCTDVGIVSELIEDKENGLIIKNRTPDTFRKAFKWCEENLDFIRNIGKLNAQIIERRRWDIIVQNFKDVFDNTISYLQRPKFRNDDVSYDTCFEKFQIFCQIFHQYGLTQVHGITLYGRTSTLFNDGLIPVEYENEKSISMMSNRKIIELSDGIRFADRIDLINYLSKIPDEIALHGLYHTDYSKMTYAEQKSDIEEGLKILNQLFPNKFIQYFIAPFNKTNKHTFTVCKEFNLEVLTDNSVHLEAELENLEIIKNSWYRYHHHRFYPESTFKHYILSLDRLDNALSKAMNKFYSTGG